MTPAEAKSPSAALCEMLLRQSPGCTWLLRRDLVVEAVYGDAPRVWGRAAADLEQHNFLSLLALPARSAWAGRVERVFAGETLYTAARFTASAPEYAITLFPVASPAGGIAFAAGCAREMEERDVAARTLHLLDTERSRLTRFLHDHVGQDLSAAGLQLDLLRMNLAESASPHTQRAADVQATLESIIDSVRTFNAESNPIAADQVGLRAALDILAGGLRAHFRGNIRIWADATATPPPHAATALYRIASEAAGNAVRHSGCTVIEILLKSLRDGPALEIRDNGCGFHVGDALQERGMGLLVMRHHADHAGIELRVESAPGKGTIVRAVCRQVGGSMGGA